MDNCQHPTNFFFRSEKFWPPPELNFEPRSTIFGKSCQKLVQKLYDLNFWARDGIVSGKLWVSYFQDVLDTQWSVDKCCLFQNQKKKSRIFKTLCSLCVHFVFTLCSLCVHLGSARDEIVSDKLSVSYFQYMLDTQWSIDKCCLLQNLNKNS